MKDLRLLKLLILFLWVIIHSSFVSYAQPHSGQREYYRIPSHVDQQEYNPQSVIFKMKQKWAEVSKSDGIDLPRFLELQAELSNGNVEKMFPNHAPPEKKSDVHGLEPVDLSLIYKMQLNNKTDVETAINQLYHSGLIEYATPEVIPELLYLPDDPFVSSQYYLEKLQMFDAWEIEQGDTNIVIAITDTGIDQFHPDLIDEIAYNYDDPLDGIDNDNDGYTDNFMGWDTGDNDNDPQYDVNAHGVHVAGASGATADNGTGIAGIGYNCRILPVKISDSDGRLVGSYQGIVYAADQGADVINCSWGGTLSPGQFGQDIINYATINRNAVVVCAGGNSDNQFRIYPGALDNAISVAATNQNDNKWEGSSFGTYIDLASPGEAIYSTWPNGSYIPGNGTSFASPQVAGAAALVRAQKPQFSALQIAAQLKVTTDNIDTVPGNEDYAGLLGSGRINVYRALTENFHPYLLLTALEHDVDYYQQYLPGETFELGLEFINLLSLSQNLTATLTAHSSFVEVVSQHSPIGEVGNMQTIDNFEQPFLVKLNPDIPPSHEVNFTIEFTTSEGDFAGSQNFSITFNLDYVDFDNGYIATTFNSRGNIGYNYPNYTQGLGFLVDNANQNRNMISCAGFIAGTSTSKVVDNVYGSVENSFSGLLTPVNNARYIDEVGVGDLRIAGSFDDSDAENQRVGIKVDYDIYAFENSGLAEVFILEYRIINTAGVDLPGFYAGFFADWSNRDIRNHRASFDPMNQLGYSYLATGGDFVGIRLLNHENVNHYAFDNQGFGGSLKIDNGFTAFEKYTAMKSARDNAGFFDIDNNVSTLISSGPFNIVESDTLVVAFALVTGSNINDLQTNSNLAFQVYNGEYLSSTHSDYHASAIDIYPNPTQDILHINISGKDVKSIQVSLYDVKGSRYFIDQSSEQEFLNGKFHHGFDVSEIPPGVYVVRVLGDASGHLIFTEKIIIQ